MMDLYLFNLLNQFAGRWEVLDNLAIFLADKFGYILIILVFIMFCLPSVALAKEGRGWKAVIQVFLAAILSRFAITEIIRFFWPRSRPFIGNNANLIISQSPSEPSFPSGHAAFYFAITAVVYFYNKKAGVAFFAGAFLISLARVFAGLHWPSDILAGALVGILSGWLVVKFSKKLKWAL